MRFIITGYMNGKDKTRKVKLQDSGLLQAWTQDKNPKEQEGWN